MTAARAKRAIALSPLAKKLGFKPGVPALFVAAPAGYLEQLRPLPEDVILASTAGRRAEFVQMFATRLHEIDEGLPKLLKAATDGAMVWVAYPKKASGMASDLSRDAVCAAVVIMGWLPVAIVSIDSVWSALRFRPREQVTSQRVWPNS